MLCGKGAYTNARKGSSSHCASGTRRPGAAELSEGVDIGRRMIMFESRIACSMIKELIFLSRMFYCVQVEIAVATSDGCSGAKTGGRYGGIHSNTK